MQNDGVVGIETISKISANQMLEVRENKVIKFYEVGYQIKRLVILWSALKDFSIPNLK